MTKDAEEKVVSEWLKLQKIYANKRPFSEEKLTIQEFSKKYWLDGEEPYQYHTIDVEDGRTEVEQLAFNNIRSLKNSITQLRRWTAEKGADKQQQIDECKKKTARTRLLTIITAVMCAAQFGILVTLRRQAQRNRQNI